MTKTCTVFLNHIASVQSEGSYKCCRSIVYSYKRICDFDYINVKSVSDYTWCGNTTSFL